MTLAEIDDAIPRDRWKRPLVVPPTGGKPVGYQRATTFAGMLEDRYRIGLWQMRMTALGMADPASDDLRLAVLAHRDERDVLDELCQTAVTLAKGDASARRGTAMHKFTEKHDRGIDPGDVPDIVAADCEAYAKATAGIVHERVECFTVVDELRIGGTPDRVSVLPDGRRVIFDLKTGDKQLEYGLGQICLQLALYSRGVLYDHDTGKRTPLDVDQNTAVVAWLPFGQAMCTLVEVDIAAGWEACQLAARVKDWRRARDLSRPLLSQNSPRPRRLAAAAPPDVNTTTGEIREANGTVLGGHDGTRHGPGPTVGGHAGTQPERRKLLTGIANPVTGSGTHEIGGGREAEPEPEPPPAPVDELANRLASATTVAELVGLWRDNRDRWTERYQEVAELRKTLIESAMV